MGKSVSIDTTTRFIPNAPPSLQLINRVIVSILALLDIAKRQDGYVLAFRLVSPYSTGFLLVRPDIMYK